MLRPSSALLACVLSVACGAPAPKPAEQPVVLAVGGAKADTTPALANAGTGRRGASDALRKAWPIDRPKVVIYADVEGLMKTRLMSDLVRSMLTMATPYMSPPQQKCVGDGLAQTKELAVGTDDDGAVVLARFDPGAAKAMGACVALLGDAKPVTVSGAAEAWQIKNETYAFTSSGLMITAKSGALERGLAARGSGAGLSTVSLGADEYVAWHAEIFDDCTPARGTLYVTADRFRVTAEGEVPNEEAAKRAEKELAKRNLQAELPSLGVAADQKQALERLIAAVDLKRDHRRLALVFDLHGTPAQQAADLGAAAALGIHGVRRYLSNAKQAEAKNAVGAIAKDMVADWEREEMPGPIGTPPKQKKLRSYPPVPKTVPRGVKYQSSPADWKPWAQLKFEMSAPQYYQYEVKAAKDGESAEVIARGDLDGNGKASEFKILVRVDRANDSLRVAPAIMETDPEE